MDDACNSFGPVGIENANRKLTNNETLKKRSWNFFFFFVELGKMEREGHDSVENILKLSFFSFLFIIFFFREMSFLTTLLAERKS